MRTIVHATSDGNGESCALWCPRVHHVCALSSDARQRVCALYRLHEAERAAALRRFARRRPSTPAAAAATDVATAVVAAVASIVAIAAITTIPYTVPLAQSLDALVRARVLRTLPLELSLARAQDAHATSILVVPGGAGVGEDFEE